ncbi:MAG: hypothetical protein IT545_03230 [Rhodobacteraceae bacterium]|nr:hypothetical protein [Paracoccaceae bacterium]
MSEETPKGEGDGGGPLVAEADALFARTVRELAAAIARLEAEGPEAAREIGEAVRALGKAMTLAFEERARADRLRRQADGEGHAGPGLDFEAARDEIGRRLARLRAHRDPGGVPCGAE